MSQDETQSKLQPEKQFTSGYLLQQAREKQKLSHMDVANKLRISEQYVKDLENDDFSHIGARIYARGYILSYSKLLGIGQDEIATAMQISLLPEENLSMQRMMEREKPAINISLKPHGHYRRHFSRWLGGVFAVTLVVLVALWWQNQKKHGDAEIINPHKELSDAAITKSMDPKPNEQRVALGSAATKSEVTKDASAPPKAPINQSPVPALSPPGLVNSATNQAVTGMASTSAPITQLPETSLENANQPQTLPANAVNNNVDPNTNVNTPNATTGLQSTQISAPPPASTTVTTSNAANNNNGPGNNNQPAVTRESVQPAATRRLAAKRGRHYYTSSKRYNRARNNASLPAPGAT